jgi:hypothetical protein
LINYWEPTGEKLSIENMTKPYDKSSQGKPELKIPASRTVNLSNITTETTTLVNTTAMTETIKQFLRYYNGTEYLFTVNETSKPKSNQSYVDKLFHLQSTNMEVRLVSVSALFGLLGACISGIMSVLTRKVWAIGTQGIARRLVYVYFARPWVGMAVALVTYISLRAGLINMGSAADVKIISDFGIAAISALVGLVSDEMVVRLRDVFRAFFGITTLQETQELLVSLPSTNIDIGKTYPVSASLAEVRSRQDLSAYFFVHDKTYATLDKNEDKFNDSGIAIVNVTGIAAGKTVISVIVRNGLDLYSSREITVGIVSASAGGQGGQQGQPQSDKE